jgi:hypothetical protein
MSCFLLLGSPGQQITSECSLSPISPSHTVCYEVKKVSIQCKLVMKIDSNSQSMGEHKFELMDNVHIFMGQEVRR